MNVEDYINSMKSKYENGCVIFSLDDDLRKITKIIPNSKGVYIFSSDDILYVGKAGTYCNGVKFKNQGLNKRINNRHEDMSRQKWIKDKLKEFQLSQININWFVTYDEERNNNDLPSYVEAKIIQVYFNEFNEIPRWHKGF